LKISPVLRSTGTRGYPPFLKDVVTAASRGLDWPSYNIKMILAGEVFSEEWRNLVCDGLEWRSSLATASLYGRRRRRAG